MTVEMKLREAEERALIAENLIPAAGVLQEAHLDPHSLEARRLFGEIVRLPDAQAMRSHVANARRTRLREASRYTPQVREHLAKEGQARPDGSYPIRNAEDVEHAVEDFNRSGGSPEDKAHIIKVAHTVEGGADKLPAAWLSLDPTRIQEAERPLADLGIPALGDDGAARSARLREAKSATDLAGLGIPLSGDASERPEAEALDGIPLLPAGASAASGTGALRRVRLTESMGNVLARIA